MPGARIPELDKCICGCSLKLGSKIIAGIFFVFSSLIFIASFGQIFKLEIDDRSSQKGNIKLYQQALLIEYALMAILSGLLATLSVCLWYGIEKHRPSFVLPWCILTTAFNAIYLIFILTTLFVHFISEFQIISLIIIGNIFYAVLIVYSHFRALRREKNIPTAFTNAE